MAYMNVRDYEKCLDQRLKEIQEQVLNIYAAERTKTGKPDNNSLQSFHATIGGKNNTFVDSVRTQFLNPQDFIAQWLKGLLDQYENKDYYYNTYKHKYIILELLRYDICKEYIFTFLERNFYRNIIERTRFKPNEILWSVWFGSNPLVWGLLISPVKRNGEWTNDVSEIRRATYKYWTIGHVMNTGLVDPENNELIKFKEYDDLFSFFKNIIKRCSKSIYEKQIIDKYILYLQHSAKIEDEPLLLPEIRYAGKGNEHKYRLDFTILNPHSLKYVGFELSPQSTHMSVSGIRSKNQKEMNQDLAEKWAYEMLKRNEYFLLFGISILTFTNEDFKDMDKCFSSIAQYLLERNTMAVNIDEQIKRLNLI